MSAPCPPVRPLVQSVCRTPLWAAVGILLLLVNAPTLAQPAMPEPEAAAQVRQAHQQAAAGRFELDFTRTQRDGIWTSRQRAAMTLAFDRKANRWRLSHPDFELQIDGETLRLKTPLAPGRHLETPIANPTPYAALVRQINAVHQPPLAPLMLLLADEPWPWLTGTPNPTITALGPGGPGEAGGPGLQLTSMDGRWTLATGGGGRVIAADWASNQQLPDGSAPVAQVAQAITWTHWDTTPPEAEFAFDTTNSTAVATLQELLNPGTSGGGGGATPQGPTGGAQAPEITLTTMDGKEIGPDELKKGVVVLDFWATWADPSLGELQRLQKAAATLRPLAEQTGTELLILGVNLEDSAEEIEAFVKRTKIQTPLARDVDGSAAGALNVMGVPHLVVIHDGKIVVSTPGPVEKLDTELPELIKPLLRTEASPADPAEPAAEAQEPPTTPDME